MDANGSLWMWTIKNREESKAGVIGSVSNNKKGKTETPIERQR